MPIPFKVRDLRNKGFFLLDDAYLNGFAKLLDPTTTCVYLSLCRHVDKEQSSFPSQDLIANEHNINARTVRRKLAVLEELNIIKVERVRSQYGKWLNNTYFLLDKSEWKKPGQPPIGHSRPVENHRTSTVKTIGHGSPHKGTHIEGNTYKGNVIIEDEDFKKWIGGSGVALDRLNDRYPLWNYSRQWEEARSYKRSLDHV